MCCPGSDGGLFFPSSEGEQLWSVPLRAILYFIGMTWCFLGVAIIADLFMAAIDQVTSATKIVKTKDGKRSVLKVWNPVVANLSLMALGSSAPEILLNVIEITTGKFMAGDLGPSTIVGSAAFNLLVILGVCVAAITEGTRRIEEMKVYAITAVTSMFAYIWLLIMLMVWTPDRITVVEGVITFAMFWVLLFAAYAAERDFFRAKKPVAPEDEEYTGAPPPLVSADTAAAGEMDDVAVKNALKMTNGMAGMDDMDDGAKVDALMEAMRPVTAATHTRNAMAWLTGKRPRPTFDAETGEIKGMGGGIMKNPDGSPMKNPDGSPMKQASPKSRGTPSPNRMRTEANMALPVAKVYFESEAVDIMEDAGEVTLVVRRSGHMADVVSIDYKTADISATAGKDYEATEGTLTFQADQREAKFTVKIIDDDRFEKAESFRVTLSEPSEGCELDTKGTIAMVTILNDDVVKNRASSVLETRLNRDKMQAGMADWKKQFQDAIQAGAEDDTPPGVPQYIIHAITVVFKVSFAFVPPVCFGGGWPAFVVSLSFIAIMTVIVGDLAGLFGCVCGLDPGITAITFVALGTSMPDLFASKAAATAEPSADACIGNVTGSNCVNVFLGLGLPWTIGALYWAYVEKDSEIQKEWAAKYGHLSAVQDFLKENPGEAYFVVEAGGLGFSVIIFTIFSLICLLTLHLRRKVYGGELGGPQPMRNVTFAFFVSLWVAYVLVSSFKIEGII
jgi:Ca2+/Na+ antiporter